MAAIIITMKDTEADTAMTTMDDGGVLFILSIERKKMRCSIKQNIKFNKKFFVLPNFVLCLSANLGPIFYIPLAYALPGAIALCVSCVS